MKFHFKGGSVLLLAGLTVFTAVSFLTSESSQAERRVYVPLKERPAEEQAAPAPETAPAIEAPAFTEMPESAPGFSGGHPGMEGEGTGSEEMGETMPPMQDMPACDFAQWVGLPVDEEAVKATGRPYRILPPGAMATMDYSADRINLHTDEQGIVIDVRCG